MRTVHPAAWVGFVLNAAIAFMIYRSLEGLDFSLSDESPEMAVAYMLDTIRPIHMALLLGQAAALALMVLRLPFALPLAVISGAPTIPSGFVYLLGCLLTHYRLKYADFSIAPPGYQGARLIVPSSALRKMRILSLAGLITIIFLLLAGEYLFLSTFLSLFLVGLYCLYRAKSNGALSLHEGYCTLHPGLFAPRLLVPYAEVELATLRENESIQFDLNTPQGPRVLIWPLQSVEPAQRRQAVEELGAALEAHGVPLQ